MTTPCRNRAHSPTLAAGKWSCVDCENGVTASPCSCGSRETYSLNPAEVVVHRPAPEPCCITEAE